MNREELYLSRSVFITYLDNMNTSKVICLRTLGFKFVFILLLKTIGYSAIKKKKKMKTLRHG